MAIQSPHCKPKHLKRLLAGSLAEELAGDVVTHLDECDSCRVHLETLAAEETWWEEARQFLAEGDDERVYIDNSPTTGDTIQLGVLADEVETTPDELVLDLLETSDQPGALGRLGEYDLLEVVGRGGMGIVFKAYDRGLKRHLAIKILAPHYASSAAARKRFAREAQAAAAVVHQHVVAIHAVEGTGKLPYLVMPFVACESLQDRIDRAGALRLEDILRIGVEVAQGLAAAHDQGLVHRDVKPANILLEEKTDRVLLTDFGLARAIDDAALTRSGIIAGTPQYMSPEQAKGESIDHRTDLFSLGSVLYAMCTGHPPFRAETTMGVLRRICDGTSIPLRETNSNIPSWLVALVEKLLEKAPEARFESAGEVAALLADCLAHVQHPTSAPPPASLTPPQTNRKWKVIGWITALTACCVLASLLSYAWQFVAPVDQEGGAGEELVEAAPSADGPASGSERAVDERESRASPGTEIPGVASRREGKAAARELRPPRSRVLQGTSQADRQGPDTLWHDTLWHDGVEADLYQIESDLLLLEATDF